MNKTYTCLDLFCGQGGAGMGYYQAGFKVIGVDIVDQPRYPFDFISRDAFAVLKDIGNNFDFIHASPPCQKYTRLWAIYKKEHPDYIDQIRQLLIQSGKPYVIENVITAPLEGITLCGTMFGLKTYRHRKFESNIPLVQPEHGKHVARLQELGRPIKDGEYWNIAGHFTGAKQCGIDLGMSWMTREGMREAIPPAYTKYIGEQILNHLRKEEENARI